MAKYLKPTPKNSVEVIQEQITPYLQSIGKQPNETVFSRSRGNDISVKNDNQEDISIGLEDIDKAILYYFNNIIKPIVTQNGQQITVPVLIGSAERWKSVQSDGFYRDKDGKLMVPLIMFKRNTITKNRTLGNKLDGNKAHLFQIFEERYNPKNSYDKFSILTNRIPSKKMYATVVPDYINVTYSCIVFTDFVDQNNKLIESIEFASDSYWGDFNRFHFRTQIDSFNTTTIIEQGKDRAAKTSFDFNVNGYIIPDSVNKEKASIKGFYTKSQIIFNLETTTSDLETFTFAPNTNNNINAGVNATTFVGDGVNVTVNNTYISNVNPNDLIYLNTNITKESTSTTLNTATFSASILEPPSGSSIPTSSINNFSFFIDGVYLPSDYIISFSSSINPVLTVDTASLGYDLNNTTVTVIGKFQ
jgi:hypothetical protein